MKLNIRPVIIVVSALIVLFLFIPIFPLAAGYHDIVYKSVFNFLFGIKVQVLGHTETIGRVVAIFTIIISIINMWKCFADAEDVKKGKSIYIITQLVCIGSWIVFTIETWAHTVGVRRIIKQAYGVGTNEGGSLFWVFFVILLNVINIAAFALVNTKYADIKNMNSEKGFSLILDPEEKQTYWICKKCNRMNGMEDRFCISCGTSRFDIGKNTETKDAYAGWICQKCGTKNDQENNFCFKCGNPRDKGE